LAAEQLKGQADAYRAAHPGKKVYLVGPADAAVAKVNDIYKKVIYLKAENYGTLVEIKDMAEAFTRDNRDYKDVTVQFDFNPVNGF